MKFSSLIKGLAVFSLFFGIISGLAMNFLLILANPFSLEPYKRFAIELGKIFLNSQAEISSSLKEFSKAESIEYKNFLIWRIIGASLLSLILIWLIYKGLRWLVPGSTTDLGTKLLIILVALGLVWFIGLLTSVSLKREFILPFQGWIDLFRYREELISFILTQYKGVSIE